MVPTENLKNDFLSLFKKAVIRGMMVLMAANTTSALANGTHEAAHPDGTKISAAPHHTKWNHKNQHEWFGECNSEGPQSPTSLRDTDHTKGTTIQIKSAAAPLRIQNTGHAIRILFPEGSTARIDGTENIIKELHFHTPGEHPINGRIYPGEAHVVT
ncbi:MAG TPA: carbonic anhydrase family protein, partial [Micavibrio sp.]